MTLLDSHLTTVSTEMEADMLCGLLRTAGIECGHRKTDVAAGAWRGAPGAGPREVIVGAGDLAVARSVLAAEGA